MVLNFASCTLKLNFVFSIQVIMYLNFFQDVFLTIFQVIQVIFLHGDILKFQVTKIYAVSALQWFNNFAVEIHR